MDTKIERAAFLASLESLSPGLAVKETISQSSCFVFHDRRVFTFNEEIACSVPSPLGDFAGAVTAKQLLDILSRLNEVAIWIKPDFVKNALVVRGDSGTRRTGVKLEAEVLLPVDQVEKPVGWKALDPEFGEALSVVAPCAAKEQNDFVFTCIHLHPDYVEATDKSSLARYYIKSGIESPVLIRAESARKIVPLGMNEVCETDSWIHFRNQKGLVLSCRRFLDEYRNVGRFFEHGSENKVTLPSEMSEIVAKAQIFSVDNKVGDQLNVKIKPGAMWVTGEGVFGWYEEKKEVQYSGDTLEFNIAPEMMLKISEKSKSQNCYIEDGRLVVETGKFSFCVSMLVPEEPVEKTV